MATQRAPGEDTRMCWTIASYQLQSPATESNSLCKSKKNTWPCQVFYGSPVKFCTPPSAPQACQGWGWQTGASQVLGPALSTGAISSWHPLPPFTSASA